MGSSVLRKEIVYNIMLRFDCLNIHQKYLFRLDNILNLFTYRISIVVLFPPFSSDNFF